MKSATSLVKHTQQGDFVYSVRRICLLPLFIFIPLMFLATNYFIEDYKGVEIIMISSFIFSFFGIAVALIASDIFLSKKKSSLWFSLGISKKTLLKNRLICSISSLIIAVFLSLAVPLFFNNYSFYYNECRTGLSDYLKEYFIITTSTAILTFLSFSLTLFFSVKTASAIKSAFLTVITMCFPVIINNFIYAFFNYCINGTLYTISGLPYSSHFDFPTYSYALAPFLLSVFFETTDDMLIYCLSAGINLLVAFSAIIFTFLLLKKHKAENINSGTEHSQLPSTIIGFTLYLETACSVILPYDYNRTCLLLLSAPVAIYFLIKLITNIKQKESCVFALKQSIPAVILSIFLVLFCKTYGFGAFINVPDVDDIEYACLTPSSNLQINSAYTPEPINDRIEVLGRFENKNDLNFITSLHRKTVKSLNKGNNCIGFYYQMKNGTTITREYYYVADEAALQSLEFTQTEWFERYLNACVGINNTGEDYIYDSYRYPEMIDTHLLYNNTLNKSVNLADSLSTVDIYFLKKTVVSDMMNLSTQEIFKPEEKPLFYLHFYSSEDPYNSPIPVYASMKNTVGYIKEKNISVDNTTADEIESVQFMKLNGDIKFAFVENEYENYSLFDKTVSAAFSKDRVMNFNKQSDIVNYDYDELNDYYDTGESIFAAYYRIDDLIKNGSLPFSSPLTLSNKDTIEKYLNGCRAHYCTIGDKGALVNFKMKSGGCFVAYVPESEL